ncbi:MAG: hypothetical protein E7039_06035 [Lentisphaerae bacterium]|nr:hypothetical protein [Lentisphaerota bacterium]
MKKIFIVAAGCVLGAVYGADNVILKRSELTEIIPKRALEIKIPAFELKNNESAVLRFQVRRDLRSGWSNTLKLFMNDVRFDNQKGILLNRPDSFSAGRFKNQQFHNYRGLLVFNTQYWGTIDGSIKESVQRKPGCFVELDITEFIVPGKENTLKFIDGGIIKLFMQNLSISKKSGVKRLLKDGSVAADMQLQESSRINTLQHLTKKGSVKITFPAVKALGKSKRVLRFQSRIKANSGWAAYLKITVNGKPLTIQKADGSSRLLNRNSVFSSKAWKNRTMGTGNTYTVFFSQSFSYIDPSIIDRKQKQEGTWFVLDCTDICQDKAAEVVFKSEFNGSLLLRNIEMGALEDASAKPNALRMKLDEGKVVIKHKVLKHGEKITVNLPEFKSSVGLLPVLRFQSRIAYKELEGWNPYLNIKINGEPLDEQDKYSESRLLNRNNVFSAVKHPDCALATRSNWLTFFTNDFDKINPAWIADAEQIKENTWFVIRLDEMLKPGKGNTLTFTNMVADKNFNYFVEVRNVEFGYLVPQTEDKVVVMPKFTGAAKVKVNNETFEISRNGAVKFMQGAVPVILESSFTYPFAGEKLNKFTCSDKVDAAAGWKPALKLGKDGFTIKASCKYYSLERQVSIKNNYIEFFDTYKNPNSEAVGVILRNNFFFAAAPAEIRFGGVKANPKFGVNGMGAPANPTVFSAFPGKSMGIMLMDTVSRAHMTASGSGSGVVFGSNALALEPKSSRTLHWRVYRTEGDYWSFVNQLRRDLNVNYTIPGYGHFVSTYQKAFPDCAFVGNFLEVMDRKRPKYIIPMPWFCYYDASTCKTAEEWLTAYRKVQAEFDQKFAKKLNAVLVPAFEPSIQPIPRDIKMLKYPQDKDLYDTDCLIVNDDGKYRFTRQWTVGKPVTNYRSYIIKDTKYYKKFMTGIKGALDAGAGGIYFDIFCVNMPTYDRIDGASGEIDKKDFTLKRRYAQGLILEEDTKREIVDYILKRGGVVICNGFPAWASMTDRPIFSFFECNDLDFNSVSGGHLGTPIGLSLSWVRREKKNGADLIAAITGRLKAGGLFYAYITELIDGKEAYEAINLMYPITIEELHPGWIVGKERTLVAVPGIYTVGGGNPPEVHHFFANGKRNTAPAAAEKLANGKYKVDLSKLADGDYAVIVVK